MVDMIAKTTTTTTVLWPLYRSIYVSQHLHLRTEESVSAKFYCPHALPDGNQRIQIREKMSEFSSTVLSTLLHYLILHTLNTVAKKQILISPAYFSTLHNKMTVFSSKWLAV